jgi:hypothetical protein
MPTCTVAGVGHARSAMPTCTVAGAGTESHRFYSKIFKKKSRKTWIFRVFFLGNLRIKSEKRARYTAFIRRFSRKTLENLWDLGPTDVIRRFSRKNLENH